MYHILLVDDETISLDGMYQVLSRTFKECMFYRALSRKEAIARLESTRIDIAVVDINMPGISGLELQKVIVERWPGCGVIFLTGYDNFDYVRQAIRMGGTDYILKLEGDRVVIEAISKRLQLLEKEEQERIIQARTRQTVEKQRQELKRYALMELLKRESLAAGLREDFAGYPELAVNLAHPVLLLVGRLKGMEEIKEKGEKIELLASVHSVFKETVKVEFAYEWFYDDSCYLIWLIQPVIHESNWQSEITVSRYGWIADQIVSYLELVQDTVYKMAHRNMLFAIDRKPSEGKEVPGRIQKLKNGIFDIGIINYEKDILVLEENVIEKNGIEDQVLSDYVLTKHKLSEHELSEQALRAHMHPGHTHPVHVIPGYGHPGHVVSEDTLSEHMHSGYELSGEERGPGRASGKAERESDPGDWKETGMETQIYQFVQDGRKEECLVFLRENLSCTPENFYMWSLSITGIVKKCKIEDEILEYVDQGKLFNLSAFQNLDEIREFLSGYLERIFQIMKERGNVQKDRLVAQINNFICANLDQDLSMAILAEQFHFNPSYLSRMYKRKMNLTISDYISEQRLRLACGLLANTDLKVQAIAKRAGFSSPAYFTQAFSRYYKMSPQEYRAKNN